MSYHMLATFSLAFSQNADGFAEGQKLASGESKQWHGTDLTKASPEELEAVLAGTVLKEFKVRLGRIGLDYQTPAVM
jgi:hypothetical protein